MLLEDEYEELRKGVCRGSSKRGFKDVTQWERPEEEEDEPPH